MRLPYFTRLFCLLALLSAAFSSCKKNDLAPDIDVPKTLTTGSWRLDEIRENSQVISSGTSIKDRFSMTFRADGTYTENQFVNGTAYAGTWMLMNNDSMLHLVDHKGDSHEYNTVSISATQLEYGAINKNNKQEVYIFSAQP